MTGVLWQQCYLLWKSGRPQLLGAGLLTVLALAGWVPGPLVRLLAPWPVWLLLVGPSWTFAVWHDEPPSRRRYMWSQPVGRVANSLSRVAAGLLWFAVMYGVVLAVGVAEAVLTGHGSQLSAVSVPGWLNLLTAPVLGYLLVSSLAVVSEHPLRWLLGLLLVPALVLAALGEWMGLNEILVRVGLRVGPYTLQGALLGPLTRDVERLKESLSAEAGRLHFVFDEPAWWISLALWTLALTGLLAFVARLHPDRLPPWRHARSGGSRRRAVAWTGGAAAVLLVGGASLWAAFARADDAGWRGEVRDSAGVEIVRNVGDGTWSPGQEWTPEEELRIGGGSDGADSPDTSFGDVAGVAVAEDGRILVLDRLAGAVRVFGPDGSLLSSMGRRGAGPGEMSPAAGPVLVGPGDTVLVPDRGLRRITLFDGSGSPAGTRLLPPATGVPVRWMQAPDGTLLEQSLAMSSSDPDRPPEPLHLMLRRTGTGRLLDTLASFPAGGTYTFSGGAPVVTLLEAEPLWTVDSRGRPIGGDGKEYRLQVLDPSGRLLRVVTRDHTPSAVTDRDRTSILEMLREGLARDGLPADQVDRLTRDVRFAERYAAFADLLAGPEGTLWVRHVAPPDELRPADGGVGVDIGGRVWDVFDADGRLLGAVRFPPRFQPLTFRGNRLYGVERDALDVESVVAFRLIGRK